MINQIKWFFQRLIRGWDDRDTWSLDYTISKFVLPRLELLKKVKHGIPCDFVNDDGTVREEEWDHIMDEMIWAHWYIINDSEGKIVWDRKIEDYQKEWDRCQKGLDLFGKYYRNLWD